MAIALTTDPIMAVEDAYELFGIKNDTKTRLLVNALTKKFLTFTGRVQLGASYTAAIVERVRGHGDSTRLWLHGAPIHVVDGAGDPLALEAQLYVDGAADDLYTYANGDLQLVHNNDNGAAIELLEGGWPDQCSSMFVEVRYFGGWLAVPGDVMQGALLQGKADLRRMEGEVGVSEKSRDGESTVYDTSSIIKPVRELWLPYRVIA